MRRYYRPCIILLLLCNMVITLRAQKLPSFRQPASLSFKENKGQVRDQSGQPRADIQFQLGTKGMSIFIGNGQIHYQWNKAIKVDAMADDNGRYQSTGPTSFTTYRLDVLLLGCNPQARVITEQALPDIDQYYTNGLNGVVSHAFSKIQYKDIYPGIDWVWYIKEGNIKYDFMVHPGADVSDIQIRYTGATRLALTEGALEVITPMGSIQEQKPFSYNAGTRELVPSEFLLHNDILSFKTAPCNGTLVIDPLIDLEWATYYGGSGLELSTIAGMDFYSFTNTTTTDKEGNVYLCGVTDGMSNMATTGVHQMTFSGGEIAEAGTEGYIVYGDVFLVKFDSTGQRKWATYYGGERNEHTGDGHSITCDSFGNIYMAGSSNSKTGIATPGAHQDTLCDPESYKWKDNFLVKFNSNGQRQWATYYGGRGHEEGGSVVVSKDGKQVYLCASATSYENIATVGAEITTIGNAPGVLWNQRPTGYIARFDNSGQLMWGSYIGSRETTNPIYDALMDQQGNIYITGSTHEGLPGPISIATPGSFQVVIGGGPDPRPADAFLQKWDSTGNRVWGTFYGGESTDRGFCLTSDDSDNIYMAGYTTSTNGTTYGPWSIATPGSMQPSLTAGGMDGFLVKFNGAGQRIWGTYYGIAEAQDEICSIAYANRELYLLGISGNKNYGMATDCAYQELSGGGPAPTSAFISRCSTDGSVDYCTYYGGQGADYGYSIAIDKTNPKSIYVAGYTSSIDKIATIGSYQESLNGSWDACLAKFTLPSVKERNLCFQDSLFIQAKDTLGNMYQWNNGVITPGQWIHTSGRYWVRYEEKPGCLTTDSFDILIYPFPVLTTTNACENKGMAAVSVTPGNGNTYTYIWNDGNGTAVRRTDSKQGDVWVNLSPGNYTLNIHTPIGCDTTIPFSIDNFPEMGLQVSNDTSITAKATAHLWASGATIYKWQPEIGLDNPSSATPNATPEHSITYTVTGWNAYGCSAQQTVHIEVLDHWFLPNVFSPNGDGLNDEFKILNWGYQKLDVFQIFNRWGQMVFSTWNPEMGWNGTFKEQPCDAGTYYYYLKLWLEDGHVRTVKGEVTLVR